MNARERLDPLQPVAIAAAGDGAARVADAAQIGFKAHNLARMAALGLPVPPAFVIGTAWCARAGELRPAVWAPALAALEAASDARFGDPRRPLLLSVRSGAPVSMPGMMETLLDIGLCDATLEGLLRLSGNPRLVWDAYRRLVAGFGEVVMGVDAAAFDADLERVAGAGPGERGLERELDFAALRALARAHLDTCRREAGEPFPQDPHEQLQRAIGAVFASWHASKAQDYRARHGIDEGIGTAVTVQRMVFGDAGGISGAGVGFTRHPSSGVPNPWVDFVFNAQGEDVVSGRRDASDAESLERLAPALWARWLEHANTLERAFGDMQDIEFTIESGHLWLLQTRAGKRTALAAVRIALDLLDEGVIDAATARERTEGIEAEALTVRRVVSDAGQPPLATAVCAAAGVACGEIALDAERVAARRAAGVPVLLLRPDADTRDVSALDGAAGLLTTRGARTAHAAVVARQMGKVCLVGCESLVIDLAARQVRLGGVQLAEGEVITLDGNEGHRDGRIWRGEARTVEERPAALLERLAALRRRAV